MLSKIHKGDYVFIQFGHNDEKPRATLHTEPGSTFDDNLRRFVNGTCAKGGNPVLFNSIVRRNFLPKGVTEIRVVMKKKVRYWLIPMGNIWNLPVGWPEK